MKTAGGDHLVSLRIENLALVRAAEIGFGPGLNVLSGETGAGKSIIVGGFNFILGARADRTVIREGAGFARVDAVFSAAGVVRGRITEICGVGFDDDQVILSRQVRADGRGECRVNGVPVSAEVLRSVASLLINIHGQHDTEALLKPRAHIAILDGFGGQKVLAARDHYMGLQAELSALKRQLKAFGGDEAERARKRDLLEFQIADIEKAALKDGEDGDLASKKARMMNFEKLSSGLSIAISLIDGDAGVDANFRQLLGALGSISHIDARAEKFAETARTIKLEIDDLAGDVQSYFDGLEYDEEEFRRIDARLDEIKVLKRKYGNTIQDVFSFLAEARASLEMLLQSNDEIQKITAEIEKVEEQLKTAGDGLVAAREQAARLLEGRMISHLADLGMPAARFLVTEISVDSCAFLFSANAGVAPRPLDKIISGGECARFMLALKCVTASIEGVATLVFDEIDTGVGGTMAHKIAEKFAQICRFHQIIVVTHLAQIAARADQHFLISKHDKGGTTETEVRKLSKPEAKQELLRMAGGDEFLTTIRSDGNN